MRGNAVWHLPRDGTGLGGDGEILGVHLSVTQGATYLQITIP